MGHRFEFQELLQGRSGDMDDGAGSTTYQASPLVFAWNSDLILDEHCNTEYIDAIKNSNPTKLICRWCGWYPKGLEDRSNQPRICTV